MVFYKFDQNLNFVTGTNKILKSTGTNNQLLGKGIFMSGGTSIFVVFGGYWADPAAGNK